MGIFKKKFFSIGGQKERFSNVGAVLKQSFNPFSKLKPTANVKQKTIKAGLEFVAKSPYTTAGIFAGGGGLAKAGAGRFASMSIGKQVLVGGAGLTLAGAGVTSEKVRVGGIKTAGKFTPESFLGGGAGIGKKIEKGDLGAGDVIKAGGVGAIIGGVGAYGLSKLDDTPKLPDIPQNIPDVPVGVYEPVDEQLIKEKPIDTGNDIPLTPETTTITTGKRTYRRRRKAQSPSVKQSVRINILNKPKASVSKKYISHTYLR